MPDIALPDYAYVPGETPRHDEGLFLPYHDSVQPNTTVQKLPKTLAWRAGLAFFDQGFFWEAHEVLEPVWMATPRNSAEHQLVQGIIQLANAALKAKMNRPQAARRLCTKARDHLRAARSAKGESIMEQTVTHWFERVDSLERQLGDDMQ